MMKNILSSDIRLVGHVIETTITDEVNGGLRCRRNRKCQSYSCYSSGRNGNETCELNDHSSHTRPQDLIPAKGFTYHEKSKHITTVKLKRRNAFNLLAFLFRL